MANAVTQILRNGEIAAWTSPGRSDAQLLDLFVRHRDPEAFALIVERYGSLVMSVCRRILRNPADVDDAFQAAFLVLARKAASITSRELLAQWLHGVAFNTARRVQRTNSRRAARERPLAGIAEPAIPATANWHSELAAVIDEEVNRLPERYRLPIVLCDLHGSTRKEAARLLGWPEGTVAGRLARARAKLMTLLKNRGLAPTSLLLAALLEEPPAAAIALDLIARVVRSAIESGMANAPSAVSAQVVQTTEGVLKAMHLQKIKSAAMALCGLAIACAAGLCLVAAAGAEPNPLAGQHGQKAETRKAPESSGKKIATVVSLKKLNARETAEKLTKLLPESVTVAPARDENVLLVYASEAATEDVFKVLQILGEERPGGPLPKQPATEAERGMSPAEKGLLLKLQLQEAELLNFLGQDHPEVVRLREKIKQIQELTSKRLQEKKFHFNMKNASWDEVFKFYASVSGLQPGNFEKPRLTGRLTFTEREDQEFTLAEITDIINDALIPQRYLLVRKTHTFVVLPSDEKIDPELARETTLDELKSRAKTELVRVMVPMPSRARASEAVQTMAKMLSPFGSVSSVTGLEKSYVVVIDFAASAERAIEAISGRQAEKKAASDKKTFAFAVKNEPWSDVLEHYAKISGLVAITSPKPRGTFTFVPQAPGKQFTLADITDIINEGLAEQKLLLVRRQVTFYVQPTDEKLDTSLLRRVDPNDLDSLGKSELVQVVIPLKNLSAEEIAKEIQILLSPLGTITTLPKSNSLLLAGSAGNLNRIVKLLTELDHASKK